ncbi:hypothetical protein Tco_0149580 [Tanacetum coccineum]
MLRSSELPSAPSPTSLPDSTPSACHVEESEDSDNSGARSTPSDSTAPLLQDHPLTCTSPTPTPTLALFHQAMALSDLAFRKRYRSSYKTPSSSSSLAFLVRKRYRGTFEPILDTDSEEDEIREEGTDEDGLDDEGHGLDDEGHSLDDEGRSVESDGLGLEGKEEAVPKGQQRAAPIVETAVGQGSRSVPEPERLERVSALRQPILTTWIDPKDGISYIDVPVYPPPAPPA